MKKFLYLALSLSTSALYAEENKGNASDPTSAVNFTDFKVQTYDLGDLGQGNDRLVYEIEGAYMLSPNDKLTYTLDYWDTDITGEDENGFDSLKLKYINLTPGMLGGVKYKLALGAEAINSYGDTDKGIGNGTYQIAPLIGAGWMLGKKDFLVTLLQYYHSYHEDSDADKVRVTGPRLIWIHSFPEYKMWLKVDNKFSIDHENDNDTSNVVEVQLGKMFTPKLGLFVDYFNNTGGYDQYDYGVGFGLRFMY